MQCKDIMQCTNIMLLLEHLQLLLKMGDPLHMLYIYLHRLGDHVFTGCEIIKEQKRTLCCFEIKVGSFSFN